MEYAENLSFCVQQCTKRPQGISDKISPETLSCHVAVPCLPDLFYIQQGTESPPGLLCKITPGVIPFLACEVQADRAVLLRRFVNERDDDAAGVDLGAAAHGLNVLCAVLIELVHLLQDDIRQVVVLHDHAEALRLE